MAVHRTPEQKSLDDALTVCKTLLIDDDVEYCTILQDYLTSYSFEFIVAHDGKSGLKALMNGTFDIVILDMFLPDMHGIEVLKRLRQVSALPVVVLSAHNEETDRIVILELGADDYVAKSFSPRELLARLRAVVRRSRRKGEEGQPGSDTLIAGDLSLDRATMEVTKKGRVLELTYLEFQLLYCMAREPGRVFSREHLLSIIRDRDFCVFDRSIDMHISALRRKLGDDSRTPVYIKTVRGAGYSFIKSD